VKWYARYDGSNVYDLMSEAQRKAHVAELNRDKEHNAFELIELKYAYNEYENFREAKKYLLTQLRTEITDMKIAIGEIKSFKRRKKA
jgi:hypothetical protein